MTDQQLDPQANQIDELQLDPDLARIFAQADQPMLSDDFSHQVIKNSRNKRNNNWLIAALLMGLLLIISDPLQNLGLALSEVLLVKLINMENQIAALVLAPLNSVAGVMSGLVLGLRLFYRQFFT